jgi:membrane protein YqaA with SNARE-associated domain
MVIRKNSRRIHFVIIGLFIATTCITIAGCVFIVINSKYLSQLQVHSYSGLFLISLLAGAPIPIFTPGVLITFALGSILNPILVGVVAGLGNVVGNVLAYWTGHGGIRFFSAIGNISELSEPGLSKIGQFFKKIKGSRLLRFVNRQDIVAIFLLSIFPNPLLTPMVLSLGAARSSFMKFLLACWAGQTIQAMVLAYVGHFGLRPLLRFLGIFSGI